MWRLLTILLFLIVSVWAGLEVIRHPGFIFISYQAWLIQMPIWFAILSLFILLFVFYIFITSIDRLQLLWIRCKNWLRFRRTNQSYSKTQEGLAFLIEGQWKKSEKFLLAGINQSVDPLINYLAAAKAAQEQGALEKRDHYIQKAYQIAPEAKLAIGLVQAELDILQNQYEHAVATLTALRQLAPYQVRVLKMLEKVFVHLADWENLQKLLPSLRKAKIITTEQTDLFEKNLYCELLRSPRHNKSKEQLMALWNEIPRQVKKNPDVVHEYIKQLFHYPPLTAESAEIEELIRKTLKNHWHGKLVIIYGRLPSAHPNRQLIIATAWVKTYGQHSELLLTLGRICTRLQLWGKAKDYFQKCLIYGPNIEATYEYGKLLEHLGEEQDALKQYQYGLADLSKNIE